MKISFVYFRIFSEYSSMTKPLLEILAENVRYYRAKTGLSQFKFAIQVEISPCDEIVCFWRGVGHSCTAFVVATV